MKLLRSCAIGALVLVLGACSTAERGNASKESAATDRAAVTAVGTTATTETVVDYTVPRAGDSSPQLPSTPEDAFKTATPFFPRSFPRDIASYTKLVDAQHATFESGPWKISISALGSGWIVTSMAGP